MDGNNTANKIKTLLFPFPRAPVNRYDEIEYRCGTLQFRFSIIQLFSSSFIVQIFFSNPIFQLLFHHIFHDRILLLIEINNIICKFVRILTLLQQVGDFENFL